MLGFAPLAATSIADDTARLPQRTGAALSRIELTGASKAMLRSAGDARAGLALAASAVATARIDAAAEYGVDLSGQAKSALVSSAQTSGLLYNFPAVKAASLAQAKAITRLPLSGAAAAQVTNALSASIRLTQGGTVHVSVSSKAALQSQIRVQGRVGARAHITSKASAVIAVIGAAAQACANISLTAQGSLFSDGTARAKTSSVGATLRSMQIAGAASAKLHSMAGVSRSVLGPTGNASATSNASSALSGSMGLDGNALSCSAVNGSSAGRVEISHLSDETAQSDVSVAVGAHPAIRVTGQAEAALITAGAARAYIKSDPLIRAHSAVAIRRDPQATPINGYGQAHLSIMAAAYEVPCDITAAFVAFRTPLSARRKAFPAQQQGGRLL